jgi:hypothetical protein
MKAYEGEIRNLRLRLPRRTGDVADIVGGEPLFCTTYLPKPDRLEIRSRANFLRAFKEILWAKEWTGDAIALRSYLSAKTEWAARDARGAVKLDPYAIRNLYGFPYAHGHYEIVDAARSLRAPVAAIITNNTLPDGNAPVLIILKQEDLESALQPAPAKSF